MTSIQSLHAGPALLHVPTSTTQREKEGSPGPRGSWKGLEGGHNRGSGSKVKAPSGAKKVPQLILAF
jgi:hypothetical protein